MEVWKKCITAASSKEGEFVPSTTRSARARFPHRLGADRFPESTQALHALIFRRAHHHSGIERAATLQDQGDDVVVERLDPRWCNARRALLQVL
jgi:hypothetical protein